MSLVRLQKAMADKGLCSRREAERHIDAGRVKVNGALVTTPGTKIDPDVDTIEFDAPEDQQHDTTGHLSLSTIIPRVVKQRHTTI